MDFIKQGQTPYEARKAVAKLLGHRDVSTTLGVYSHVVPEVFSGVTAAVNDVSAICWQGLMRRR